MAIKAKDAISTARALIGTPYGSDPGELDCINLIKKVIRTAPGGVPDYTTAGTNTLWRSYDASPKCRDLTARQHGISGAKPGMIAFKNSGDDYHHAGIVTGDGTVIHASGPTGRYQQTVETALDGSWTALGVHRYIEPDYGYDEKEEEPMESYKATVTLKNASSSLNVRNGPGTGYRVVGSVPHGASVTVLSEPTGEWAYIAYSGGEGYVSLGYLIREAEAPEEEDQEPAPEGGGPVITTLVSDDGQIIELVGRWSIAED